MQGAGAIGQRIGQGRVDAASDGARDRKAQAFGHALGGTTGGRGQGDARGRGVRGVCLGDAQQQQAGDGGGLAGAGAAGDQQQGAAQRQGGGLGLAVWVVGWGRWGRTFLVDGWLGQARALTRPSGTLSHVERGSLGE